MFSFICGMYGKKNPLKKLHRLEIVKICYTDAFI
jgi:hypothetical protein